MLYSYSSTLMITSLPVPRAPSRLNRLPSHLKQKPQTIVRNSSNEREGTHNNSSRDLPRNGAIYPPGRCIMNHRTKTWSWTATQPTVLGHDTGWPLLAVPKPVAMKPSSLLQKSRVRLSIPSAVPFPLGWHEFFHFFTRFSSTKHWTVRTLKLAWTGR